MYRPTPRSAGAIIRDRAGGASPRPRARRPRSSPRSTLNSSRPSVIRSSWNSSTSSSSSRRRHRRRSLPNFSRPTAGRPRPWSRSRTARRRSTSSSSLGRRSAVVLHDATRQREELQADAVGDQSPNSPGCDQHHGDGNSAQYEQIEAAKVGEHLTKQEKQQRADDRTLDPADAADYRDEDDERRPVIDAESGVRRYPQLLQEYQRADRGGPKRRHHIDDHLHLRHGNAIVARGRFIVADRRECKAVARAQQKNHDADDCDDQNEGCPIDQVLSPLTGRGNRNDDRRRQAGA